MKVSGKVQEILKELERGLEDFQSSNMWQSYLDTLAKFHNYSPCNCLLIKIQKPEASLVAGFNTWKKLGRYVKKGEQGIAILAPVYKTIKNDEEEEEKVLIGFRTVYVFDISQTEGKELNLNLYHPLAGDAPKELAIKVETYIKKLGYKILYEDCGKAEGYVDYSKKTVVINTNREPLTQLAALIHELAHIVLCASNQPRGEKEFEAESVSYAVLKFFGIDTGKSAFAYITLWHPTMKDFLERANRVQRAVNEILENI